MEGDAKGKRLLKQEYPPEFRERAVKRVKTGRTAGAVAKEPGWIEQTLRNGVKAFGAGKLKGPSTKQGTPEQMGLSKGRAENLRRKRENEIRKKAAAYFAKEVL